jgi:N6-L-threonylcarbamoyladenine synthase
MCINILGIESSCDDTAAAIIQDGYLLSGKIANQDIHKSYGGVVPELASRAHQQHIIPVVDVALQEARLSPEDIHAVAFTAGPGLLGSLLVGTSFAKGFALARNIPLININHLHAHIISIFLHTRNETKSMPKFPFLCLLVSGGHTQIIIVKDYLEYEIIGQSIDDAAGEAFDKCAKLLELPYPGGPLIDKYAVDGNPDTYSFTKPKIEGLDLSFSGLKTAFLYFLRDRTRQNPDFIKTNRNHICASIQHTIIEILLEKLKLAVQQTGIKQVALAGGVSANSGLRQSITGLAAEENWNIYIPALTYSTDNASMIAMTGYYKYLKKQFCDLDVTAFARA